MKSRWCRWMCKLILEIQFVYRYGVSSETTYLQKNPKKTGASSQTIVIKTMVQIYTSGMKVTLDVCLRMNQIMDTKEFASVDFADIATTVSTNLWGRHRSDLQWPYICGLYEPWLLHCTTQMIPNRRLKYEMAIHCRFCEREKAFLNLSHFQLSYRTIQEGFELPRLRAI